MVRVLDASFSRLGFSGDDVFAEVEVRAEGFDAPLVAAFKQEKDGRLELVNVSEKRAVHELDWYENNLHEAYPDAMERLFGAGSDGGMTRRDFAEQVLNVPGIREQVEDALFYHS